VKSILNPFRHLAVQDAIQHSLAVVALLAVSTQAFALEGRRAMVEGRSRPMAAPEINPALIVGAVVLIVGCILIYASRRRRAVSAPKS